MRNEELQRRKAVASNYDMFADDYSDTNVRQFSFKYSRIDGGIFQSPGVMRMKDSTNEGDNKHLNDNWDDSEGYYRMY